jgi:hypothetical protein
MKTLFSLLFITFITLAHATDSVKKPKKERRPPMWDTLYCKNELSLDVGAPISFLLKPSNQNSAWALSYQRALTKRDFLRVSTRHSFEHSFTSANNLDDSTNTYILPLTNYNLHDSVITQTSKTYRYYSPDIRIGYEHRFGKRRVKGILGMDVLFGAEIENTTYQYRYFKPEIVTGGSGNTSVLLTEITRGPEFVSSRSINLKEGLAPFVGVFVHIAKHWSMRASLMYDFNWTQSVSFVSDSPALIAPGNSFKVYSQSIIADISITGHF